MVKLHRAFQTNSEVFLVMDYQPGGELLHHMKREGLFDEVKIEKTPMHTKNVHAGYRLPYGFISQK